MIYRLQNAVEFVENKLDDLDYYNSLTSLIQGVPNVEGYNPKHMSDYILEKFVNV
jgi:hypothetical protein